MNNSSKEQFCEKFEVLGKKKLVKDCKKMVKCQQTKCKKELENIKKIKSSSKIQKITKECIKKHNKVENVGLLKKLMKKLDLNDNDEDQNENKKFYEYYGIKGGFDERIGKMRDGYTFQNVLKNYKQYATKNQNEFKKYMEKQNKFYNQVKKENNKNK